MAKRFFLAIILGLGAFCGVVEAAKATVKPREIGAKAYILMEAGTQRVLLKHHENKQVSPASITKLMTAYVVYQAIANGEIATTDKIAVGRNARYKAIGSRMFLELGSEVSIDQLLHGLVIQSGNDAAIALAEAVSGTEEDFVELMNAAAKQLGMKNSHFKNVTGLTEEGHYMSAKDIAILSRAIITEFPKDYQLYKQRSFTWNKIKQDNRNGLLQLDPSVDGLKTGHTEAAGYCLASSAKRGKMRLISVVLGTQSPRAREQASKKLLDYGFAHYAIKLLYQAGKKAASVAIEDGVDETLDISVLKDVALPVRKTGKPEIEAFLQVDKTIEAPVTRGQQVGTIDFQLSGQLYYQVPVVAMKSVAEIGFFAGLWRSITSIFD
ncbi:MAG: serine-type D-Ala-D-Ala carboxypeptidase [Gammaproteobacteria bacterium]|nr:MAG: serine-type D-Ala-D-Ala carboxypeptidase [Gammaproteobacteria bacterium]